MKNQVDLGLLGSDSAAIGDKRCSDELGEKQETVRKRTKLRDLHSVFRSEEISNYQLKHGEASDNFQLGGETSQVTNLPMPFDLDASQVGRDGNAMEVNRSLDLNSDVNGSPECPKKYDTEHYDKCNSTGAVSLDLSAEDGHLKPRRDASECGSTNGPVEEKDPLRVWKEMKENGFLSSAAHGGDGVSV